MTDENDLKLIRQIIAGGERKYTAGNIDRGKYERLVDLGWLTSSATNISDVEYNVTEKGRAAASKNDGDAGHPPPGGSEAPINFDAPAVLRKWPSLRNERRTEGTGPFYSSTAPLMSAYGSSWPSRRPRAACTKYILHHSRR